MKLVDTPEEIEQRSAQFDEVIASNEGASDLESHERIAHALAEKAALLQGVGQNEEAALVCDDLLGRFGKRTEQPLRYYVAYALYKKGEMMELLVRDTEAAAAFAALLGNFTEGESEEIDALLSHAQRRRQQIIRAHHWGE